ncbi:hypothetical protein PV327_007442 [Microctonus hyperodae]|uniref:Uncharacterized protein n=1 Tax=Microctonus hyperodae TaxID=165561 RepID=A0AA39G0H7_MICHY|nr:hypothetical protein PV327_007442 [Microctonus hyperodae]
MTSQQSRQLFLVDEGNKKSYTLTVSSEEYEKASTDPDYGGILLVEHLKAGRAVRIEDIQIGYNCIGELCNDENVAANDQSEQPVRVENLEIKDELLDVSCHKNKQDNHQSDQESNVPLIEPQPKKAKPLQTLFEEIIVDRHVKHQSDILKHKEKVSRSDRFNDCMESMAQSFSVIAAAKKAKL